MTETTGYVFEDKKIPAEALEQTETWYDKNGKQFNIAEMSKQHANASLRFIVKYHGLRARTSPLYEALYRQSWRGPQS